MTIVTELLERLAGVATLREKVAEASQRVDRIGEWLLELDRRVTWIEAANTRGNGRPRLPKK